MNSFQPQFQAPQFTQPYTPPYTPPQQTQTFTQPAAQAQQPVAAQGSLGKGWDQGTRAGGHGAAAKFPDQGSVWAGYVARDMTDADCRQAREPSKDGNGPLKFFKKSGQPQYEYIIPANVQPSADYPDGKSTLFTSKYRLHSAVVRAMQEAQYQPGEGLHEGDFIEVQRIADVASGYGQPGHDFVARVTRREVIANTQATSVDIPATQAAPVEFASAGGSAQTGVVTNMAPVNGVADVTPQDIANAPAIPGLTPELAALVAKYQGSLPQG